MADDAAGHSTSTEPLSVEEMEEESVVYEYDVIKVITIPLYTQPSRGGHRPRSATAHEVENPFFYRPAKFGRLHGLN